MKSQNSNSLSPNLAGSTKKPRAKSRKQEESMQKAVCTWLKFQYCDVIFRSDGGGIRLTMGQAMKVKAIQHSRSFPDLFICEARGGYHGLFLELKRKDESVWLRDGALTVNPHIREQYEMIKELRKRGFCADFAVGFDDAKKKINNYLKL